MDTLSSIEAFESVFKPSLSAISACAIVLELALIFYLKKAWDFKSTATSFACFAITMLSGALFHITVVYYIHGFLYEYRVFDLGFAWYGWVICFVLIDLMFYITHRMHHRIRVLWCVHSVHHSAEEFQLPVGIRGSFLDTASQFPVYAWLPLIGIHPLMYLITDTLFKFLIFLYHTELIGKMGVMDKVFVTPSNHRVHHASNSQYIDKNYGGVFIIADRVLGTFEPESEKPAYGIRGKTATNNVLEIQTREFASLWRDIIEAPSLREKLLYIVKPPGWRHKSVSPVLQESVGGSCGNT